MTPVNAGAGRGWDSVRMSVPLQITFRHIEKSEALDARIRAESIKLERAFSRISHCRVAIEEAQRRQSRGGPFVVTIEVRVPRHDLAVTQEDEDVYVAVRDAFAAIRRQLDELSRDARLA